MTGSNEAELLGLDASIFSVVGDACGSNYNVGLNKAGQLRLYAEKTSGNGNTLTITATGVTITKIVVAFGSKIGSFTVNGVAGSSSTLEYEINGSEVVIKNVDTAGTQLHFTSIEIFYE